MKKKFFFVTITCIAICSVQLFGKPFVKGKLVGQLGNQMFIVAATYALALENNAEPLFPDFQFPPKNDRTNLIGNYENIFFRLNRGPMKKATSIYKEPFYHYSTIKYKDGMEIQGYFQSEKYFKKHKMAILDLFKPSDKIVNYLKKYKNIIDHPKTVSIHFRSYLKEDPTGSLHPTLKMEYFERAIKLFPKDSLFVVFSNDINKCKRDFAHLDKNIQFIENEMHVHDFYLMSMCKNHIISNSSFSWWAAYLNKNPNKIVIAPSIWVGPKYSMLNTKDLIPNEWKILKI